jgi:hypothetical protein
MQGKQLFEYAVIRIVPRVEREEFLNAGIIMYCSGLRFLQALYILDERRLGCFSSAPETTELKEYLDAIDRICRGEKDAGPIARLTLAERFRWITATRSTVVQTSKVHTGFCTDAAETLAKLHAQLVL